MNITIRTIVYYPRTLHSFPFNHFQFLKIVNYLYILLPSHDSYAVIYNELSQLRILRMRVSTYSVDNIR